jgi:hypothetical protein
VDFAEDAREVVGIVESGVEGSLGDVHFAAGQEVAGAGEALAQEKLVEGVAGLLFEDAVEMIGARAAGAGDLRQGKLRVACGFLANDGEDPLGEQAVTPRGVAEMLAEALGALGGAKTEGDEAEQERLDKGGVADLALVVLIDDLAEAIIEQLVIHGAQLEGARGLDVEEAEKDGDLVFHGQPAEGDETGVLDEEIERQAERRGARGGAEVMANAGRDEEDGTLAGGVGLAVGLDPAAAALVVENLVMGMGVGLGRIGDGGVLVELDAEEVEDGAAETVIDIRPENVLPALGDEPVGVEGARDELGSDQLREFTRAGARRKAPEGRRSISGNLAYAPKSRAGRRSLLSSIRNIRMSRTDAANQEYFLESSWIARTHFTASTFSGFPK